MLDLLVNGRGKARLFARGGIFLHDTSFDRLVDRGLRGTESRMRVSTLFCDELPNIFYGIVRRATPSDIYDSPTLRCAEGFLC